MQILIIEDELPAYKKLVSYLDIFFDENYVHIHSRTIEAAIKYIKTSSFDLILSDIELLDGNVFNLFNKITVSAPIIFCTAYDSYTINAFKENGIAYLIKPYTQEEFNQALKKYINLISTPATSTKKLQLLSNLIDNKQQQFKKRILIKKGPVYKVLEMQNIVLIEAFGDLIKFVDSSGNHSHASKSIGQIEDEISSQMFFRINRSQIVNINFIEAMESHSRNRLAIKMKRIKKLIITSTSRTKVFRVWIEK